MVVASGGLNQQRNQIVDAVVIARVLGATLVLPVLQVNQVWGDESEFGDIFDERHFKGTLRNDVVVVSSLPSTHLMKRKVNAPLMPFNTDEDWLLTNHMPKLTRHTILILRTFDSRLSKNLSTDLQKLRCKVAFEAIKFQPWIEETADRLVRRMSMNGPYMALHLRLEKDVWVRTGCLPGLGEEADIEIKNERSSNPNLLTSRSNSSAGDRYLAGLCPLNGLEISMLLNGLGMPKNTRIYLAGGEPFGGDKALKPLKLHFPQLYNKWSLAKSGELDGLKQKPSILAALDYIVCLKSQLFMENHGGNMARALQGHRIYMDYGKHIKPNKRLLVQLFQNKSLEDSEIKKKIKQIHIESPYLDLKTKTHNMDVVTFPNHHCMCNKDLKVLNAKK
ncbi:hypothetical protein J5N97_026493 [Dioscorea zingiberensis]|uniref:O-fucosyltransferase family protein n=1 Tax=Dioscorea zingiberensis TaxID=325984 RepID=A0A9D5H6U3_9LILI|nr:hypothetical protein J5N97_026493 [Dioscorea zingiberensis]